MTYIPDNDPRLASARDQVRTAFEVGNLCSVSRASEIAEVAMEAMADNGLPRRCSLALMIGKQAQADWLGAIDKTKQEVG